MPLPILQVHHDPSGPDLVRLFHRTSAMWVTHLADGEALDVGAAYANRDLPDVWDANNLRDASLHENLSPADAVAQVRDYYTGQGTQCAYWVMNPSAPPAQTQPLVDHLLAGGYRRQSDDILYLRKVALQDVTPPPGLKVIPARASYRHVEILVREGRTGPHLDQRVQAALRHLDDPHYDALIALQGDQPVASLGVMSVGELAEIQQVYVSPAFRRQGIGRLMMNRGLEICARSLSRQIFILTEPHNLPAQSLYKGFGFSKIGVFDAYYAPHTNPQMQGSL